MPMRWDHGTSRPSVRELAYHSSYSHRGQYYTLNEIARFDALGLWSFRSVWFSRGGLAPAINGARIGGRCGRSRMGA